MKRVRQAVAAFLAAIALCFLLPSAAIAADGTASLTVIGAGAPRGGNVSVVVELAQTSGICGGSMEIVYPETLTLVKAEAGELLSGTAAQVNPNYTADSVRVNFASTAPVGEKGNVCVLTFQVKEGAPLGDTTVSLRNVRLYDENVASVAAEVRNGTVEVQYAKLRVSSVEAVAGQSVRMELFLEGGLDPAGGSFTIAYDDTKLTAGGVVAGTILSGHLLSSNKTEAGIRVNWAGAEPVTEKGMLCTVTFHVKQGAAGTADVGIRDFVCYDQEGLRLDTLQEDGTITLLTPTEQNPKLWVVGGAVDSESGKALVSVVLEGRGEICGGSFQLTYPTTGCTLKEVKNTAYTESTVSAVNNQEPGKIVFSWAGAAPSVQSEALIQLEFSVTDLTGDLLLELGEARMLDADGAAAVQVDIRSGKLLSDQTKFQLPTVDTMSVESGSGTTAVELGLDIADAAHFSEDGVQAGATQLVMVLYQEEKMQTVAMKQEDFSLKFDENGIAQVQVSASCVGSADSVKVFLLDGSGSMVPLSEQVTQELAESHV